jgi:hypothetical protein
MILRTDLVARSRPPVVAIFVSLSSSLIRHRPVPYARWQPVKEVAGEDGRDLPRTPVGRPRKRVMRRLKTVARRACT